MKHNFIWLSCGVMVIAACAGGEQRTPPPYAAQSLTVSDGGTAIAVPSSERRIDAPFPASGGRSIVADIVESSAARTGSRPGNGLRGLSTEELSEYGEVLRRAAAGRRDAVRIRGAVSRRPPTAEQRLSFTQLAREATGTLDVEWNDSRGTPVTLGNLLFVRRGLAPRALWEAFLDAHFADIAPIFHLEDRSEVSLTGQSNLGAEGVLLHGKRLRDGLPVDGEFVEVLVSADGSRMGGGVLTQIHAVVDGNRAALPSIARSRWVSQAQARQTADDRWVAADRTHRQEDATAHPAAATLRLSCGPTCSPYWRVVYRDGWTVHVDAINGSVTAAQQDRHHIGPLLIQGRPPGSTSPQPVRFRGANVVDPSTGASLGETSPIDGTHNLTQSAPVSIGFEGPVGSTNPAAYGRVEAHGWDGSAYVLSPLRQSWTPSSQPTFNFGSPDLWPAFSDPTFTSPHSTEIIYGWMTYWQNLFTNHVSREVTQRLAFLVNMDTSLTGILCFGADSDNFATPDANGLDTWGSIYCNTNFNDDVNTAFTTNGDSIFSASHEFGHTVNNCAAESGYGCANDNPTLIPIGSRPGISDWRIAIHGSENEVAATAVSNVLTGFRYANTRDGVPYDEDWNYTSYDSTTDSFGTSTEDAPSQLSCPDAFTCPTSPVNYLCVLTDQNYNTASNMGGLCARACNPMAANPCPAGLFCQNWTLRAGGSATVCLHNGYQNKFWDTVGDRLAYTLNWRESLAETLTAAGGQSNNPTRDLVLGADSYYSRYLYDIDNRFEVTRAVRSVYSGPSFVANDDFTDRFDHGAVIPVRSNSWTPLWWGNGVGSFPTFTDANDIDVVMFRGNAQSVYAMEAEFMDTSGSPTIVIHRLSSPSTYWVSYSGALTTDPLPATDWYVAWAWGGIGNARWQGKIRLESGYDDVVDDIAEALPVAHGFTANATSTGSGDVDVFQIHVPIPNTSLEINVSGLSSGDVKIYDPSGTLYNTYNITSTNTTLYVASLPSAGHWTWKVTAGSTGAYTTNAWMGCGFSSPGCDTSPGTRATRQAWGDNFAGRLPNSTTEHIYTVSLAEAQGVSVSVSDTGQPCGVEVSVYAPSTPSTQAQPHFGGQAVMRWTDGAAVSDPLGYVQGVGGYIEAISAGTYQFRVRTADPATCGFYRIHFATSGNRGPVMPAW